MLIYNNIKFDDYTKNEDGTFWTQVCDSCIGKYNFEALLLDDCGSGICGVEGCNNESDNYLDFPALSLSIGRNYKRTA